MNPHIAQMLIRRSRRGFMDFLKPGVEVRPEDPFTLVSEEDGSTVYVTTVNPDRMAPRVFQCATSADPVYRPFTMEEEGKLVLNKGDKVSLVGNNDGLGRGNSTATQFVMTGRIGAYGNMLTLLYRDSYMDTEHGRMLHPEGVEIPFCGLVQAFAGCTSLTHAPALPAVSVQSYGCSSLFSGCTSLTEPPETVPPPKDAGCVRALASMFEGCTSLKRAPALPATTLSNSCYIAMFKDCASLVSAPELPATDVPDSAYNAMFQGCSKLETLPALPATELGANAYRAMFYVCGGLTSAAGLDLVAQDVPDGAYYEMFRGCGNLKEPPSIRATSAGEDAMRGMFMYCVKLAEAPDLHVTQLTGKGQFRQMFNSCLLITAPPELPAAALTENCYYGMFYNCTALATCPALPAGQPAPGCYREMFTACRSLTSASVGLKSMSGVCCVNMFSGCSKLESVETALEALPAESNHEGWLKNVKAAGTFTKPAALEIPEGSALVPAGWTVVDR